MNHNQISAYYFTEAKQQQGLKYDEKPNGPHLQKSRRCCV